MKNFFWRIVARIISKPRIAEYLIARAMNTPYVHLPSNEDPSYMARYWLFNPYDRVTNKPRWRFIPWSIRIHHIKREDQDRALHDHPWNARTIILKGAYIESRLVDKADFGGQFIGSTEKNFYRTPGVTAKLGFEEYHRITEVSNGGVWTLFISGPWQGVWGFLVDGVKVPWKKYLGIPEKGDLSDATKPTGFATGGYVSSTGLNPNEVPAILTNERVMPNDMFKGRTPGKLGEWADNNRLIVPNINAQFGKMGQSNTLKIVDEVEQKDLDPTSNANMLKAGEALSAFQAERKEIRDRFIQAVSAEIIATDAPKPDTKEWADNLHAAIIEDNIAQRVCDCTHEGCETSCEHCDPENRLGWR